MKVFKECCGNCLLSSDSIVSPDRRKEILKETFREGSHFICHKASMKEEDVCCKKFYDSFGDRSQMVRIAERLGAVKFVDQTDNEKLPSFNEINKNNR